MNNQVMIGIFEIFVGVFNVDIFHGPPEVE